MNSPFRTNAANSSKPMSAPVFKKAFLDEIPIIRDGIFNYPGMYDIDLFKLSTKVKELIDNTFILNKSELFDKNWILESDKYVKGLSVEDKGTILGYTYQGDEYVNNYLRDPTNFPQNLLKEKKKKTILQYDIEKIFTNCGKNSIIIKGFPLFVQLFKKNGINTTQYFDAKGHINTMGLKKACEVLESIGIKVNTPIETVFKILIPYIELFGDDLKRIIRDAPRLTMPLKVFRGAGTDYLNQSMLLKGFTSTTISLYVAEKRFSAYNYNSLNNNKILYEFIINIGVPCLFIPPEHTWPGIDGKAEFEVLIDSDVNAIPTNSMFKRIFNPPSNKCYLNKEIIQKLNLDAGKKKELVDAYNKDHNNYAYAEMISLIEVRNYGEEFKTRTISLSASNNKGGRRKTIRKNNIRKTYKKTRT
jgi:hypothetical protein